MHPSTSVRLAFSVPLLCLFIAMVLCACGDSGSGAAPTSIPPQASPTQAASASGTPAPLATNPALTSTATASPAGSSPTVGSALLEAAKSAAMDELDALYVSPLNLESCTRNNPSRKMCIELKSDSGDAAHGVVRFVTGAPDPGSAAQVFFGRSPDGAWHYWFGTQNTPYQLTKFPADGFVCSRAAGLNIRQQPSATSPVVALLNDLAPIHAEEFVLTRAAVPSKSEIEPDGWYRISAPVAGWVNSRYVSDAALKTCEFHDGMQRGS